MVKLGFGCHVSCSRVWFQPTLGIALSFANPGWHGTDTILTWHSVHFPDKPTLQRVKGILEYSQDYPTWSVFASLSAPIQIAIKAVRAVRIDQSTRISNLAIMTFPPVVLSLPL